MLVILESPYAGNVERNLAYARAAMRDSIMLGEAPIASHLLYTQPGILDDNDEEERDIGIRRFYQWHSVAEMMVVYYDHGFSPGMQLAMRAWRRTKKPVAYRILGINDGAQRIARAVASLPPAPEATEASLKNIFGRGRGRNG